MGNVGSTASRQGTTSQRIGATRQRVIVDPPFDEAETTNAVSDLVVHTQQLHCCNKENAIEPEITPLCHDEDQIPVRIDLDTSRERNRR